MCFIVECTIRDGSYIINNKWHPDSIKYLVAKLVESGFKFIEIGNGTGLGTYRTDAGATTDKDYLLNSIPFKGDSKIGMFFIPDIGSLQDIEIFSKEGGDFLRIGLNAGDIEDSVDYINYAKKLGLFVSLNILKTYIETPDQISRRIEKIEKYSQPDVYTIVDSAGGMLPKNVSDYVQSVKKIINRPIGFHGHNNLLLANANSLAAIEAGAEFVDSTLMGFGRGAGNAQTESLIALLNRAGFIQKVDPIHVFDYSKPFIEKITLNIKGVNKRELVSGIAFFHSSFEPRIEKIASSYSIDPDELILEVSKVNKVNPSEELIELTAQRLAFDFN